MGDNFYLGDRNGVRTPMHWSGDRNAGFSKANPQRLYLPVIIDPEYHYEASNVETQQSNPHSLLHWMKRLIALRRRHQAFGRGSIEFLHPSNHKVLAFIRAYADERILIVANLSRFAEYVELDLSRYPGMVPVELFSGRSFPAVGEQATLLTLGPHSFYWFRLETPTAAAGEELEVAAARIPEIRVEGSWEALFRGRGGEALEALLPAMLASRRWFGGKGGRIRSGRIVDTIPLRNGVPAGLIALIEVDQEQHGAATYALPLGFAARPEVRSLLRDRTQAIFAEVELVNREGSSDGLLFDALVSPELCAALLDAIRRGRALRGSSGELRSIRTRAFRELLGPEDDQLVPSLLAVEQSNSSVMYGDRLMLKLYRRLSEGTHPDLEVGRFLTERAHFAHAPAVAGALEYRVGRREPITLALLQAYVVNEGDAWQFTLDQVESFYDRALALRSEVPEVPVPEGTPLDLSEQQPPALVAEIGSYLEVARLLGQRTAELHLALACDRDDPDFAPEPSSSLYQRGQYQSMRTSATRALELLRRRCDLLSEPTASEAVALLSREEELLDGFRAIVGPPLGGMRIRCHGDYHLGQVLYTGNDFVIIDFEGEPARPLSERRLKRSPLRDVAGMLRSFDYAAHTALFGSAEQGAIRAADVPELEPWARFWRQWASSAFLRAYLPPVRQKGLVPVGREEFATLLRVLLLDKSVYELGYELNNRPAWARVPIRGILDLLGAVP
jgi:maltose alpha-D-glucosyltransferase/alpha-amylase